MYGGPKLLGCTKGRGKISMNVLGAAPAPGHLLVPPPARLSASGRRAPALFILTLPLAEALEHLLLLALALGPPLDVRGGERRDGRGLKLFQGHTWCNCCTCTYAWFIGIAVHLPRPRLPERRDAHGRRLRTQNGRPTQRGRRASPRICTSEAAYKCRAPPRVWLKPTRSRGSRAVLAR